MSGELSQGRGTMGRKVAARTTVRRSRMLCAWELRITADFFVWWAKLAGGAAQTWKRLAYLSTILYLSNRGVT
jgi:hypothetical protein